MVHYLHLPAPVKITTVRDLSDATNLSTATSPQKEILQNTDDGKGCNFSHMMHNFLM